MRTLLTGERATTQAARVAVHLKLEVQNGSGTWKDLGALLGDDYVVGARWGETLDTPVSSATFSIRRRAGTHSLAPLILASALNIDDTSAYSPLLEMGRGIRLSTATLTPGVTPASGDWRQVFIGRIDKVNDASDPMVLDCSDLGAWLMDTQIEVEGTEYGVPGTGVAMETVIQNIVNAWPSGKGTPTLLKASSNTFMVTKWPQGRTKVLEAIRDIALQSTGEDVRFRYDSTGVSKLTLFDPQRSRSTVDATFGPTEYRAVPLNERSIANIRNAGLIPYVDAAGVLHTAPASDSISIAAYGRRYFELPESDSITTSTDANALIGKVVNDLASSPLDHAIETSYVWFVQLYDRHTLLANGDHYDQDQTLGVVGYEHEAKDGAAFTTITYRDRIVGAYADWLKGIATFADLAPSLDVVATPGPTNYSIAYSFSGGPILLSIDGGTPTTPAASPISVARPTAGSLPKEYSFSVTAGDQTVSDSVTIPAIGGATTDTDTVTPDLAVTPGTVTSTTQQYTASATNPKTAASVPVLVKVKGTTATDSAGGSYADGAAYSGMTAGATLTVQRPAFATVAGATVSLRAELSGGGAETIQRTILPQVKTTFGPSLDVVATPSSGSYSIAYVGSGGTVELSINGGSYSTAPASPISVTRPTAGSAPGNYSFRIVADGQTITDSVDIQPIGGATTDTNTVTPDLSVIPSTPTTTAQSFTVTASDPSGLTTPSIYVILRGTTGSGDSGVGALPDSSSSGTEYIIPSGCVVTVNRPAFGTTTQASVTFRATIGGGGGTERIQRTILNQVKTSFGPSLTVDVTPGTSTYTIAYTGTGTVELSIDGGTWSTAPSSPISVTRDTSDHSYDFRATLDGQVVPGHADVPALPPAGGGSSPTTAVVTRAWISAVNYSANTIDVSFAYTGSLGFGQFEVIRIRTLGSSGGDLSGSTSSHGITTGTTVSNTVPDDIISTSGPKVTYSFAVLVKDGSSTVLQSFGWIENFYSYV